MHISLLEKGAAVTHFGVLVAKVPVMFILFDILGCTQILTSHDAVLTPYEC
jgi:hypothetical protein